MCTLKKEKRRCNNVTKAWIRNCGIVLVSDRLFLDNSNLYSLICQVKKNKCKQNKTKFCFFFLLLFFIGVSNKLRFKSHLEVLQLLQRLVYIVYGSVFLVLKYHIFYGKSDFNTMSENKTKQNNISHAEQKTKQKGVPNHSTYVYVKVVN